MAAYTSGVTVHLRTVPVFADRNGVATDPASVTLRVRTPSGRELAYTYVSAQLTREGVGDYSRDIIASESGTWAYRWDGSGELQPQHEETFFVQPPDEAAASSGGGATIADASITPAKLAPGLITYRDFRLTNAQIKASHTTPVDIVPAPGAGLSLFLYGFAGVLDARGGAYVLASGSVDLTWGADPVHIDLSTFKLHFDQATLQTYANSLLTNMMDGGPLADNGAFTISSTAVDLTGGHAANSLSGRVWYAIVPTVPFGA